jgi:hypothetical protein
LEGRILKLEGVKQAQGRSRRLTKEREICCVEKGERRRMNV